MQDARWTTITPSQFDHERAALEHVRRLLPDAEPYRAWSNFTFTADTGHVYEIDLLVAARAGLYLVEIKSLHGRLTNSGPNWIADNQRDNQGSVRTFDNPLHLADLKAKRLRSLLDRQAAKQKLKVRVPFIQGAVFLSAPDLQVQLDEHQLHWVYGPEPHPGQPAGPLPGIWSDLLGALPRDERRQVTPEVSRALPRLLREVGIARSRRYEQVGSWQLQAKPFDVGPTWQDHLAEHAQFAHEQRRIRIYLLERNSAKAERASIERAARREMIALHGISHPGIVQVDTMEPHEGGPALIFRHDPRAVRLDHFMAQYGERLDVGTRIGMVRQLVEAIGYAHGRRLYHRSLSARGVLVTPGQRQRGEPEEAAWLRPQLQISDWQAATRGPDSVGGSADALRISPSSRLGPHLERSAEAYLAPESSAPAPDPVALDVFGLGTLAYLLLSGQPPAASRAELLARLAKEDGLRPSSTVDSVSEFMDELVQAATAPVPARRLASVAELLEMLQLVEEEFTAPPAVAEEHIDVLEAKLGDTVLDWQIRKKLGTGSTSRAFLAENTRTGALEVLKVALSDEKAARLSHEAQVLRGLHKDSRVIRLAREEPIEVPPRWMIVLEHAGEKTLARKLREDGRLTVDELETYSDYLFGAVDHLQGEGVFHRDIKPDNIAIRIRPNRTRQLVLFDFSLAALPVDEIEAGTPRYLDPFLGTTTRPVYDEQAERYAVAVTLHEMASGEIPVWGDDLTNPLHTEGPPVLAVEAFDPAIRGALVGFFQRALHRDAGQRHASLKEMRDAWQQVFRQSDHTAPVGSEHPAGSEHPDVEVETTVADRDEAAARATRATVLEASGLTPRAVSAAHRLDATTVGDLLGLGSKQLFTLPGLGAKTRGELQQRLREWRVRLGEQESGPAPSRNRVEARAEIAAETVRADERPGADGRSPTDLARIGLDAVAAFLVPQHPNQKQVEAVRLLLGLPDEAGALPDLPPWPLQSQVAKRIEVSAGRVAQYLMAERKRWHADPVLASVRAELITLLAESGRVMEATELATALLVRRGSGEDFEPVRRAVALAVVRAAVEIDPLADEPRFAVRRHGDPSPERRNRDRLLIALEVAADESPDTPSAPALLDLADALGKAADRLAELEVLPSPATVLRELAAVTVGDQGFRLDDRRMVQLAAVASARAAASPRLEIYPRDLDPVRALRLTQAGLVPPSTTQRRAELREKDIQQRVAARFPEMPPLPGHPRLGHLLAEAGFPLIYRNGAYHARPGTGSSTRMSSQQRRSTDSRMTMWNAASPELAAAFRAEDQLGRTGEEGGFRALTVRTDRYPAAQHELVHRLNARPCNVAGRFLAQLRTLVEARPKPTWKTVLAADAADPNSRDALKLAEFATRTWQQLRPELLALPDRRLPLLLFDAAPLARYGAMELLEELADLARGGAGAVWLLCPMEDPGQLPRLDATVVPVAQDEWVTLPDAWVANEHRHGRPPQ
ncbi:BREX system serine/threonine kinase PglW [Plantactinospora sp. WMMB782]|uniref:BREX system serine/threonine kinase PglW n=1 Tax=Plantactinospora sp. WMMB782 TaxID=3404121 RepID=UPI003B94EE50